MDCVFCKIISGEIPGQKVWEDDKYAAFLDLFPYRLGQTIVMPKKHRPSYAFGLADNDLAGLTLAAKTVGRKLDTVLGAVRTCMLYEGFGVDHVHAKLYPIQPEEKMEGLVPLGTKAGEEELEKLADKIRKEG